jgi:hypothetical protein
MRRSDRRRGCAGAIVSRERRCIGVSESASRPVEPINPETGTNYWPNRWMNYEPFTFVDGVRHAWVTYEIDRDVSP